MTCLNIVFMGTPDFAVPSLRALHQAGHKVSLVVSQPDRRQGRGRKLLPPAVKTIAEQLGYPVAQPESMRDEAFVTQLRQLAPDLMVVVAFGHLLPQALLQLPRLGAINLHASLLPAYRGAAPIQWAVINGDPVSGVTTMVMDTGMDTGDILLQARTPLEKTETTVSLHDRLAIMGAELLVETLHRLTQGNLVPRPQDEAEATIAHRLTKADGEINWQWPALKLDAFIRGMVPWPGAFTFHDQTRLKIHKASPLMEKVTAAPGTVLPAFPDELRIATADGALLIEEIQSAAGKRMPIARFLRGYRIEAGEQLGGNEPAKTGQSSD